MKGYAMKARALLAGAMLTITLFGCNAIENWDNPGYRKVTYHQVTRAELTQISGDETLIGYADWDEYDCDIYIMPIDKYNSDECHQNVINHELKHCADGPFHGDDYFAINSCYGMNR